MNIHDHEKERGHSLVPDAETLAKIPALYATDGVPLEEKLVYAHYFIGGSDWHLMEVDQEEWLAFGWVCLNGDVQMAELGYFSLHELASVVARGRLRFVDEHGNTSSEGTMPVYVERELGWVPKAFGDLNVAH